MKKKAAPKNTSHRVHHRTAKKSSPIVKYVLLVAGILILLLIAPPTKRPTAGLLAQTGLFYGEAKEITWPKVDKAVSYNIYYKRDKDREFIYSITGIPADKTSYTITHLKRGKVYEYKVAAVNAQGEEFLWTTAESTPSPY